MADGIRNKRLGVIGGLGPMATAYFLERIVDMTDAGSDQEHLDMLIYHLPSIPDRTRYILDRSQASPVLPMIRIGQTLAAQQVCCIAIPCITAHYFHDELTQTIGCPILHAIRETAACLSDARVACAGILATDGTLAGNLFQDALAERGIRSVTPTRQGQSLVMDLIYRDIKAGLPPRMDRFTAVSETLRSQGAEVVLLGCTELSLLKRGRDIGHGFLDVLDILACSALAACGVPRKPFCHNLIT